MLLEKWSTSYLRSTMLKHKPHAAKLKITATNSLQSITPRLRSSSCAPGSARPSRSSCTAGGKERPRLARVAAPGAQPALTFPSIPGHNCGASGRGTAQSPPSSHATSAHRAPCASELGTDAQQTKNLLFFPQDSPCAVRNFYILLKMMI